jgi:hypothetical protein
LATSRFLDFLALSHAGEAAAHSVVALAYKVRNFSCCQWLSTSAKGIEDGLALACAGNFMRGADHAPCPIVPIELESCLNFFDVPAAPVNCDTTASSCPNVPFEHQDGIGCAG